MAPVPRTPGVAEELLNNVLEVVDRTFVVEVERYGKSVDVGVIPVGPTEVERDLGLLAQPLQVDPQIGPPNRALQPGRPGRSQDPPVVVHGPVDLGVG